MDKLSVSVKENCNLPKLCWVLQLSLKSQQAEISVGSRVEILEEGIVEGCWDGDFSSHEFTKSNLFGSAVEWGGESLLVSGSISLTDRICYAEDCNRVIVSNSLFAVMAVIGAEFDGSVNYNKISYAPVAGIDDYPSEIPVKHETIRFVHQLYHRNMTISSNGEVASWCKTSSCEFSSFKDYEDRLSRSVHDLVKNITSEQRVHKVSPYATLSSGYDSTAVAALAKCSGVGTALLCAKPKSRLSDILGKRYFDDGSEAALALNLRIEYVNLRDVHIDHDELLYIAPSASTPETSFLPMAKHIEKSGNLGAIFTGYHGDKVWDLNIDDRYANDQLIRGDMSGINISEARLKSGFFNVAVPFLFARSLESIVAISRSKEMSDWSIGGGYDRPVPRRIAEERGVARESFGIKKKAIIDRYPNPKNNQLSKDFRGFMKSYFHYSDFSFWIMKYYFFYSTSIGAKLFHRSMKPVHDLISLIGCGFGLRTSELKSL